MRIKFWGTRGSIPSPGFSTIKYGGNTPCVELESNNGDLLILDCGSGLRVLGNDLLKRRKPIEASILLSHTHWDHIQGFPFFKPFFFPGNKFNLYGPKDTGQRIQDVLEGQMEHRYFPITLNMMASKLEFYELKEEALNIGKFEINIHYMNHTSLTLGFKIVEENKSICYCTDTEPHSVYLENDESIDKKDQQHFVHHGDRSFVEFVKNSELLIVDAQYTKEEYETKKGWGHSTIDYVVMVAMMAQVKRLCLFHHDPEHDDKMIDGFVEHSKRIIEKHGGNLEIFAATEGNELII